jgi:hypothetical protein
VTFSQGEFDMNIDHDRLSMVHQGVDTLRCSYVIKDFDVYRNYYDLLDYLDDFKEKAKLNNDEFGQDFEIFEFRAFGRYKMYSKSTSSFKYTIENDNFTIFFATYGFGSNNYNTAQITVDFRSKYLFSLGHKRAYNQVQSILNELLKAKKEDFKILLNRIDLCTDVMGIKYTALDKHRFKHKFKMTSYMNFQEYTRFNTITGFFFGGGDFSFRIYDKSSEIKRKISKNFVVQKWILNGYCDLTEPSVWRHEVQYRRPYLKRFLKDNIEDEVLYFFDRIDSLWSYAVDKIRYIDLTQDELFRVVDSDLKPDSKRQIFYRAEKDSGRFHFWQEIISWDNELATKLVKIERLQQTDETIPVRFLKSYLSTAFKHSDGDPTSVLSIFMNFQNDLKRYENKTIYDYLQLKQLSSYVKNAKVVEDFGLNVEIDYKIRARKIFSELQDRLGDIDDKDYKRSKRYLEEVA